MAEIMKPEIENLGSHNRPFEVLIKFALKHPTDAFAQDPVGYGISLHRIFIEGHTVWFPIFGVRSRVIRGVESHCPFKSICSQQS